MTNKKHQHFRMSDESSHHIFYHHHKIAIFVAIFATIILCAVILIQQDSKQDNAEQVVAEQKKVDLENNYTDQVKVVLQNFLDGRLSEDFNCEQEVNSTVAQVLNLTVPVIHKAFHLELVVLLDKESNNCETQSKDLDLEWENFLNKYDWLNK